MIVDEAVTGVGVLGCVSVVEVDEFEKSDEVASVPILEDVVLAVSPGVMDKFMSTGAVVVAEEFVGTVVDATGSVFDRTTLLDCTA